MKKCRLCLPLLLCVLCLPAVAQNYLFSVPEAKVTVEIQEDGAARIHYALTFTCMQGAHPIDIVDIGMPNMGDHQPISAAVNGNPLPDGSIQISTYVEPRGSAYEVHLGAHTIMPGQTGVFEFTGREEDLVWQDTTDPEQASFRFTPTWFGSQYVRGGTMLTLRYVLPIPAEDYPQVESRILWQQKGQDFDVKGVMEGEEYASVAWVRQVSLTGPNMFGISFPKQYVGDVRKMTLFGLFYRWFSETKEVQMASGAVLIIVFAITFFILTRGTGWSVFLVLTAAGIVGMYQSPKIHLLLYPFVLLMIVLAWLLRNRRKKRYFPAEFCIEGGGIKRGLTAVEAAMLLEVPLHRVLAMVIFGLTKKGALQIVENDPLRVEVIGEKIGDLWKLPGDEKNRLRGYEYAFLKAFRAHPGKPVEKLDLETPFNTLLEGVKKAMAGFDFDATREYYRSIVTRAWKRVEDEANYDVKYQEVDKTFDWLMLDEGWDRRMRDTERDRPFVPHWWGPRYIGVPHTRTAGPAVPSAPSGPGRSPGTPSFGDVASSMVGRFENMSSSLVGKLDAATTSRGGINLTAFDTFTTEFLESLAKSGGGRGGGGGCACAGCACACACAGGGR